jgi:hypothetical protein
MTPQPGWRKLVDLPAAAVRQQLALERWLTGHEIIFTAHTSQTHGYRRYLVLKVDLCCARAVLEAIAHLDDDPTPPYVEAA